MRKRIVFVLMLVLCFPLVTILAAESNETSYYQINMILGSSKQLTDANIHQIADMTSGLSSMQRSMLFESNKKSSTVPFVVNLLVGFGIGSYIQGDTTGGNIALAGDLGSIGLFYGGYAKALSAVYSSSPYDDTEGSGMMVAGMIGLLMTRVFELIRPFSYATDYNMKLSNALMNISMVPVIDKNNDMLVRLAANINF